jgi:hypothetical protein
MKKMIIAAMMVLPVLGAAQDVKEQPRYGISFTGFVKNDFFYDTRESVTIREGHFLLYPREVQPDADGIDINDKNSFNFLSIQTRLTGKITAPDAFGAKTSGVIEADFFGNENAAFVDANGFRLRHAFVKLNWAHTELLAGQYWHPFFQPGCFSGVISFNTGAPFQPFSRNPQLRLQYKPGALSLAVAMSAQRDFSSPQGTASLRYASQPDLNAIISYEYGGKDGKPAILAGVAGGYKTLQPLLTVKKGDQVYVTDEKVSGISGTAFFSLKTDPVTFKLQAVYGQNLFDLTMLGGYAVSSITDSLRNKVSYSTLNNFSAWTEIQTNGARVQYALWAGYTQNLGSRDPLLVFSNKIDGTDATVRGANIHSLYRVSPRVVFISGKLNIAAEMEYTVAQYATRDENGKLNRDAFGKITQSEDVANLRMLLAFIYNF